MLLGVEERFEVFDAMSALIVVLSRVFRFFVEVLNKVIIVLCSNVVLLMLLFGGVMLQ
jgi:hypothetical protein